MLEEHRRIFGFWPPSGPAARCPSRASRGARPYFIPKNTFTRTFVCLVDSEQDVIPDASERIRLSMAGLGEAKIVFNKDGNALHVHEKIIESFSALAEGGGYEMLRKLEGSTKWLMQIPHPRKGFNFGQAKAFLRPTQGESCAGRPERYNDINISSKAVFCNELVSVSKGLRGHGWVLAIIVYFSKGLNSHG